MKSEGSTLSIDSGLNLDTGNLKLKNIEIDSDGSNLNINNGNLLIDGNLRFKRISSENFPQLLTISDATTIKVEKNTIIEGCIYTIFMKKKGTIINLGEQDTITSTTDNSGITFTYDGSDIFFFALS